MRIKRGIKQKFPILTRPLYVVLCLSIAGLATYFTDVSTIEAAPPCPCNIFSASLPDSPLNVYSQPGGIEVGVRFTADQSGYINGIKFYKVAGMAGTHTASLWTSNGQQIAQAVFTSESAQGWQQVDFSPVAIAAGTMYTASVLMADGNYTSQANYFTSDIINSPLTAPKDGTAYDSLGNSGQGIYTATATSAYPSSSYNASNYWVDVSYVGSPDQSAPQVTATYPASGAQDVKVNANTVSATFNTSMDPGTIDQNSFVVKDAAGNPVTGNVSYDKQNHVAIFDATGLWQTSAGYTVTLHGGASPNAMKDLQGNPIAVDYSWSFTASAQAMDCPCSLFNRQNPAGSNSYRNTTNTTGLELGLKVVARQNGYITALRFYKPIINPDATHTGHVWDKNGNLLASVTFTNESDYGWQEASLSTPLAVTKGDLYIISYGINTAIYQARVGSLTSARESSGLIAYPDGDSHNAASGSGNTNAVFASTAGNFPTSAGNGDEYYVDAVFAIQSGDVLPPSIVTTLPSNASYGVSRNTSIRAEFDQPLDSSTVVAANLSMKDASNQAVSGSWSYDSGKHAIVFTPASALANNTGYTVSISGNVKDLRGLSVGQHSWTFTTGGPLATDINQGNGGPVLVLTRSGDAYSNYYAEILRTEGMNYFDVKDVSTLSATLLSQYKLVLLSSLTPTQDQVNVLTTWVQNGGNLIAMKPDDSLTGLLGLRNSSGVLTNKYVRTNTASTAGRGIVDEAIQFKGDANLYPLNGAYVVASLYQDDTTPANYPAVTTRSVGAGTAMAFSYDLARSVIGLHQGNALWSGQDRDGDGVIRSTDLFYGAANNDPQPDWLNAAKMDIPQADEQQRLLANMVTAALSSTMPAPRFWYMPGDLQAAVVMAGDDHGQPNDVGTEQVMNNWLNDSPTGCAFDQWQCVRASHYLYTDSPLTTQRASQYVSYGFELGPHFSNNKLCDTFASLGDLSVNMTSSINNWQSVYPSLPAALSSRYHCYLWPNWDMLTLANAAHGIRYDLTSVAYPSQWVTGHSPMVTGSGMNMRLTDSVGNITDVRQGVTNFDNVSAGSSEIAAALDNALGAKGYYGFFGSHYDMTEDYDRILFNAARSRGVPLITSQEVVTWLDGRGSSNFATLSPLQGGHLRFTIAVGEGAENLRAMLPVHGGDGILVSLRHNGGTVVTTTKMVKGVEYAMFSAVPGNYDAVFSSSSGSGGGASAGSDHSDRATPDQRTGSVARSSSSPGRPLVADKGDSGRDLQTNRTAPAPSRTEQGTYPKPESDEQSLRHQSPDLADDDRTAKPFVITTGLAVLALVGPVAWWLINRSKKPGSHVSS